MNRIIVCTVTAFAVLLGSPAAVGAAEVRFFTMASREAFLEGSFEGVSVDSLGTLRLANRVARVGAVEEPFVFTAVPHPRGWVLGTGNSGRVLLVDRDGGVETLLEAADPTVFALAVDATGVVWAGSSPGGIVYRIEDGIAEPFYETGETYVWGLAVDAEGMLWIATGTEGRLHRVAADGSGEVVLDVDDVHLRSLATLPGGGLLIGTGGEGLLLRLEPEGSVRTLYDSGLVEIVDIERGANGDCFAAIVAAQAGWAETAQPMNGQGGGGAGGATVTVSEQEGAVAARPNGGAQPRSRIVRFPCVGGVVETVWSFTEETPYDLLWAEERLWIGTGEQGKLYSLANGDLVLEKDVDERQIVAVMPDRVGPALATTNAAALYRVLDESETAGSYTSPALDAGEIARFGTLHWRGNVAGAGTVAFSFRSGMSAEPDATWSDWSGPRQGAELALAGLAPGRYLQFRVELGAGSPSPSLSEITISYRQMNLAPKIASVEVLEAGQVLVPSNFNPASQVYEPVTPNRDGIFTRLGPERERDNQRLKPLWKRGFRTLKWESEDPNDDELRYRLEFRPDDAATSGSWFPIADDLEEAYLSFDATVLPDGVYRFRVVASDGAANGDGAALKAERITEPVTIDHTPPVRGRVSREDGAIAIEIRDALSPLRQADYSLDGRRWVAAEPVDGLLDGRFERFRIDADPSVRLVLFRVMDAAFNLQTFDLSEAGR